MSWRTKNICSENKRMDWQSLICYFACSFTGFIQDKFLSFFSQESRIRNAFTSQPSGISILCQMCCLPNSVILKFMVNCSLSVSPASNTPLVTGLHEGIWACSKHLYLFLVFLPHLIFHKMISISSNWFYSHNMYIINRTLKNNVYCLTQPIHSRWCVASDFLGQHNPFFTRVGDGI